MTRLMYRKNERTRLTKMLSLVLAVVFTLSFTGLGRVFATDEPVAESPAADSVAAPSDPAPEAEAPEVEAEEPAEAPAEEPVAEKSEPKVEVDKEEPKAKDKDDEENEDEGKDGEPPHDPGGYETVEGNPALGDNCFKFEGAGTYQVELEDGTMVTIVVTIEDTEDGQFLSWTSTVPVESVIVKGGPNANIYGGGTSGSGLHAPLNPGNDEMWPDISWVGFCFGDGGGGGGEPTGAINVLKFNDENGNGEQDEGEEPLEGWTFVLTNMEDEELGTEVTDEDGMASFVGLMDGEYMVTEVLEEDWEVTTGSVSQHVVIENGEAVDLVFGNRMKTVEKMWTKTFSLHINGDINVAVDGYGVAFMVDGEAEERMLVGTMPHFFINMDVPEGTVISDWRFFAMVDGERVWLTEAGGEEIIDSDTLNEETFVPGEICGIKYIDVDGDSAGPGDPDDDLGAGVTLILNGPGVDDYEVVTDAEGNYCFEGLLPGTYMVSEDGMPDWSVVYPEMWPAEVMLMLGEMSATLDIVNQPPLAAIDVDKSVDVETAMRGDTVVWTVTVTNTGQVTIEHFDIIDELLGIDQTIHESLEPGESWSMDFEYTVPEDAEAGELENCVEILAYPVVGPPIPGEDCASIVVVVPGEPMVDVSKLADVATVPVGGEINYTITYTNTSEVEADDFTIIDDYPQNLVTVTDAGGATDDGDTLTWLITEPLAPGASRTVSYTVLANGPDAADGVNIVNTVTIPEFEVEDTETVVIGPDVVPSSMSIAKTANRGTVEPGGFITYTISYTNTGEETINNFTIVDDYPENLVTVTDPNGGVVAGGVITWTINVPLAPGQTRSFNYLVRANDNLPDGTDIPNVATIVEYDVSDNALVEVNVLEFLPFTPSDGAPFLPFTGNELLATIFAVLLSAMLGLALRMASRRTA